LEVKQSEKKQKLGVNLLHKKRTLDSEKLKEKERPGVGLIKRQQKVTTSQKQGNVQDSCYSSGGEGVAPEGVCGDSKEGGMRLTTKVCTKYFGTRWGLGWGHFTRRGGEKGQRSVRGIQKEEGVGGGGGD